MGPDMTNIDAHKLVAEQAQMLLAFSAVSSDSEEESDDEDDDDADAELLMAIEAEVKSRRTIEQSERSKESE